MLLRAMAQGFYISRSIMTDSSMVTPVEKNITMTKFHVSAYSICFYVCIGRFLWHRVHIRQELISLRFLPPFFFWL